VPGPPHPAIETSHGTRDSHKVALTFHGQGDPALADRLLSDLAASGTRVTVLAVGTWLAAEPQLARRMLAAGHEIGNHTQHHGDLQRMSPAQVHDEIDQCARVLRSVTGSIGRWFRPSQTRHATDTIRAQAARVGYRICLSYDVDSLDYTDPPPATIVDTTLRSVRGGSIVSLHLGHAGTVAAIAPLLAGLRRLQLIPVTMTELIR
jgi:peptidoglycan/xylan/chitin deacetylase (PgdA/CDA1 family)